VAISALALSLAALEPWPRLIASRRVDFHLRGNAFSRWKYGRVDCFICASDAIRSMLLADGIPAARALTVHEGIDIEHVAAVPAANIHAELWLPSGAPVVGNIAALVPHKGQKYLIDAAALVVREIPDARFVVVGEGELRPALERQIHEHHLERHVLLTGFRPDVLSLLKAFDVFVLSSVTEGLGTSLLDAMACARPIVATRVGGIPEVVADGEVGILVPPRDPEALAGAIGGLLDDVWKRREFGRAGAQRVRARFSAAQMVAATLSVYQAVAGRSREADTSHHAAHG
jgi:glycosyltransferase involved in cell wall biosynthesis